MRARQKLILDALVIRKAGEGGSGIEGLVDSTEGKSGEEDGEIDKLSVDELWSMLSHGAERQFDPTADSRPQPTAAEYDAMLDSARPANVQEEASARLDELAAEDAEAREEEWSEPSELATGLTIASASSACAPATSAVTSPLERLIAYICPKVGGVSSQPTSVSATSH